MKAKTISRVEYQVLLIYNVGIKNGNVNEKEKKMNCFYLCWQAFSIAIEIALYREILFLYLDWISNVCFSSIKSKQIKRVEQKRYFLPCNSLFISFASGVCWAKRMMFLQLIRDVVMLWQRACCKSLSFVAALIKYYQWCFSLFLICHVLLSSKWINGGDSFVCRCLYLVWS